MAEREPNIIPRVLREAQEHVDKANFNLNHPDMSNVGSGNDVLKNPGVLARGRERIRQFMVKRNKAKIRRKMKDFEVRYTLDNQPDISKKSDLNSNNFN